MPRSHDSFFWVTVARDMIAFAPAAGTGIAVWYRKKGACHWPMTYGKVEYAMTTDVDGWKCNLTYSYAAGGEFYSGVLPLKARSEADSDEQVSNWKGQSLTIRYSPRNPAISVVRMEDQASLSGGEFRGALNAH